ncbi:MAG: hypothetical protein D0528_04895 [Methylococcales bacterium]|nr:MAG: hypothetical protein D0528_04895 [Methylococcales bacterium]
MHSNTPKLFVYAALPCEAKPVVEYFNLKKELTVQPFAVYLNKDICLTVTGIGKSAMAAGVAYTQALFSSDQPYFMLNLGIAGHQASALGELFLMDKITDVDNQRRYYPSQVFSLPCQKGSIQTVSKPQLAYDSLDFFDMEASAFYETAVRFCASEFIFCLKVVSDNQRSSVENIQPKQVSEGIARHLTVVDLLLSRIVAQTEWVNQSEPQLFEDCVQRYYVTVNERQQLKKLLSHWDLLTDHQGIEIDTSSLKSAKELLRWLNLKIQGVDFYL